MNNLDNAVRQLKMAGQSLDRAMFAERINHRYNREHGAGMALAQIGAAAAFAIAHAEGKKGRPFTALFMVKELRGQAIRAVVADAIQLSTLKENLDECLAEMKMQVGAEATEKELGLA